MKRIGFIVGTTLLLATSAWAQPAQFPVTIVADNPNVRFEVDGVLYHGQAAFFWAENTPHFLHFPASEEGYQYIGGPNPAGGNVVMANTRFVFDGWEDASGTLDLGNSFFAVLQAHPDANEIHVRVRTQYKVLLNFWNAPASELEPAPAVCAAGLTEGPGVIKIGETCYWRNTEFWLDGGPVSLEAIALPGFAFNGWIINNLSPVTFLQAVEIASPTVIAPIFRPAKRVKFLTNPLGYQVQVDGAKLATPQRDPCPSTDLAPPIFPGAPQRCIGELDWALGSQHIIGVPDAQRDAQGRELVFDSFSNGMENHSIYEVTSLNPPETIIAKLVPGARVSFVTQPSGLKLDIDGRDDWLAYNFTVAPGKVFQVTAPDEQVDADGRKWVFAGWSNGGERAQEVPVPAAAVDNGLRLTATYELLSQAVIETVPSNISLEVDGAACESPCSIDRPDGAEVTVTVPESQEVNPQYRFDFVSWSDGGPRTRTVAIGGAESIHLVARYRTMFKLETSSVPAGGASFQLDPSSADAFYEKGTSVQVTATAEDGFHFRRWGGDLEGTTPVGRLSMTRPRSAVAMLNELDVAPEAHAQNAAGLTPEDTVAPGSIISIYSETLAPDLQIGPTNPLAQTLLGTTVRVADRVLALLFVSPWQVNAVLHPDTGAGRQTLTISRPGELDITTEINVARNAPGLFVRIFNEKQYVMAAHEDGSPVTPDSPARLGEVITIYGTGFGPYDKIAPYGFSLPAAPAFSLVDAIEVFANDIALTPEFVGGAAGFSGTDVIKLPITDALPAQSTLELKARINGHESNVVLLPIGGAGATGQQTAEPSVFSPGVDPALSAKPERRGKGR